MSHTLLLIPFLLFLKEELAALLTFNLILNNNLIPAATLLYQTITKTKTYIHFSFIPFASTKHPIAQMTNNVAIKFLVKSSVIIHPSGFHINTNDDKKENTPVMFKMILIFNIMIKLFILLLIIILFIIVFILFWPCNIIYILYYIVINYYINII